MSLGRLWLRQSRNWKWLVILFVCLCLFVFIKRAWKMFSVICIFLTKNQWFERKYIDLFYQVVMETVLWGPNYPVLAVQSYQRAVEYINVDDIVAFCLYLMKKAVDCHYLLFLWVSINTTETIGWWWMRRENNRLVVVVVVVDNHVCALSCADLFCVLRS